MLCSQAVLIAIGIKREGHRQMLTVRLSKRESQTSRKEILLGLKTRGLRSVDIVSPDDQYGTRALRR